MKTEWLWVIAFHDWCVASDVLLQCFEALVFMCLLVICVSIICQKIRALKGGWINEEQVFCNFCTIVIPLIGKRDEYHNSYFNHSCTVMFQCQFILVHQLFCFHQFTVKVIRENFIQLKNSLINPPGKLIFTVLVNQVSLMTHYMWL